MLIIEDTHINNLIKKISIKLLKNNNINVVRNLKTLNLNDIWCVLKNPNNNIITLPERNLNIKYLNAEMNWYKSGNLNIKYINKYSSFWKTIADNNKTINSNYGFIALIEKFNGISQYEWCVNSFKKDKFTRQAIINYNQPKFKYNNNKDFVCSISQQFIFRNNQLDCVVLMRSNDLIYGFSYDVPWFTYLQIKIANELNLKLGYYNHYACDMHVYEKHFKIIKKIYKKYNKGGKNEIKKIV